MLSWTLGRRLVGRLGSRTALLPVLVIIFFAFGTNVFLDEQTLTGEQEADRLPGRYDASISRLRYVVPTGNAFLPSLQARFNRSGIPVVVSQQTPDFPLYELSEDGIFYREMPWSPQPFPDAMELRKGRFPTSPGEVALLSPGADDTRLGRQFGVLGQSNVLTVVGLVENRLTNQSEVLAAPGTWATLDRRAGSELSQLLASPTFFVDDPHPSSVVPALANELLKAKLPALAGASADAVQRDLVVALRTRADARADTKELWTARSPLSFWAPVLTLTPLAVVLAYWASMRRLGPAARSMTRQGVPRRSAVTGTWAAVMAGVLMMTVVAGVPGSVLGHVSAQLGAGSWSEPGATWRIPISSLTGVSVGLVVGGIGGWLMLWMATRESRPRTWGVRWSPSVTKNLRHAAVTLVACALIFVTVGLRTPDDVIGFSALAAVGAALWTPDVLRWVVGARPSGSLKRRLTTRLLSTYSPRNGVTAATLVLAVALSIGLLTSVTSAVEAQRLSQESTARPGQVALDNDGAPVIPVPRLVVDAAESVPSLANQDPVQLRVIGEYGRVPGLDMLDLHRTAGVADFLSLTLAFDRSVDVARALGRSLSPDEEGTLEDGGVLIIDEEVLFEGGEIALVENDSRRPLGTFPSLATSIDPVPWFDAVGAVMLTGTAKSHGLPVSSGAVIYTDISAADAAAVLDALSARGVNPENAEVYRELPPIVPVPALYGSAIGLFLLLLFLAAAATRAQVVAMRPWASRLTQLGVKVRWARQVVLFQYSWILGIAIPLGLVAGVLPLLLASVLLPEIVISVPWGGVSVLLTALVLSVVAACWLSMRGIDSRAALGWQDQGEESA